jgi:hypothetical protein
MKITFIKTLKANQNKGMLAIIQFRIPSPLDCYIKMQTLNRPTILPDILFGCKIRFLTLTEVQRLRMIENRVLRNIFSPK